MELVIFDLDGVIVSTDRFHFRGWRLIEDAMNLRFDEAVNHRLRGVSRRESLEVILEVNNTVIDEVRVVACQEKKNNAYREMLGELTPD